MNTYHWAFILIMVMIVLAMPLSCRLRRPNTKQNIIRQNETSKL